MPSYNVNKKNNFEKIVPLPALILLLIIFLIPLINTLTQAFVEDGSFTLSFIKEAFTSPYTRQILSFTINQALVSTLICLLIGLPGAYLLSNYEIKSKKVILGICSIPFILPSILVILGFVSFYGNNGLLNQLLMKLFNLDEAPLKILYSYKAIILAHSFYNFPVILLLVTTYWDNLNPKLESSSYVFGATRIQTFFNVTLRRLLPSILSSSLLVFLFCFTSFSIILVLGGGPKYTTMEVEIYRQARINMNINAAAAYSLVSILFCIVLLLLYLSSQKLLSSSESIVNDSYYKQKKPASKGGKIAAILYFFMAIIFVLAPILSIIFKSFRGTITRGGDKVFTLKFYRQLFGMESSSGVMNDATPAIFMSLKIATIVALLMIPIVLSLAISTKRKNTFSSNLIELIAMLPIAISSVIIGLGYYLISARATSIPPMILVVLAHLVIALPFALRIITPELDKLPKFLSLSAISLGASPFRAFVDIELPLIKKPLIKAAIFSFATSMGEINATLVLSSSKIETIPVVMYRLIGSYNFAGACALGTILIVVCAIVFITSGSSKKV
ncbi:MAG: iron ABC transporter permease [Spirochaetaceae bacterium]|nr:iron ABC transporter permease [Spirochaetaceae bacterium]